MCSVWGSFATSQLVLVVKNSLAKAGDVRELGCEISLGQEDSLEEKMATRSSILA